MKGVFQRIKDSLVPIGDQAKEALQAIKDGQKCMVEIRAARNPEQANLFWALCQLVAEADDDTKENVKKWLCVSCNQVSVWFEPDGRMHVDPASIAYESMPQAEFNQFFQAAIHKVADRLGCKAAEVRTRFEEMTAPRN